MKQILINEEERKLIIVGNEKKGVQIQIEYDDLDAYIDLNNEEVNTLIWALRNEVDELKQLLTPDVVGRSEQFYCWSEDSQHKMCANQCEDCKNDPLNKQ